MTNRLTWIKRRARRIEAAFGTPRRVALNAAVMDRNAFIGLRLRVVEALAGQRERTAA